MSVFYPAIFITILILILGLVYILFLGVFNPSWWKYRTVKLLSYLLPVFGVVSTLAWTYAATSNLYSLLLPGALGTAVTVILEVALVLSLPFSGIFHGVNWLANKFRKVAVIEDKSTIPDKRRRTLLKAAVVFPFMAISAGGAGAFRSFGKTMIPRKVFSYTNLPAGLDGLKILQLSDSHLGYFVSVGDFEGFIRNACDLEPDIVLVTGDIADDLHQLPDALKLISELKPEYGCYACPGNHEYYRGMATVRKAFDKSPIPFLVNQGVEININGDNLYIAGTDDPRWMRNVNPQFFQKAIEKSMTACPENAFKLLMCHRPDGFDFAAEIGIELTLSGHTHGGQVGINGKSIFEDIIDYKYIWGHYAKPNGSRLYTSAGIGHWFPFRLGCPPEAPLITLSRSMD